MTDEVKGLINDLGKAVKEFQDSNDQRMTEIEKQDRNDPILNEKVNKMNDRIDELETQKAEIEKQLARKTKEQARQDVDLDAKANQFSEILTKKSGRAVQINGDQFASYEKALKSWMRNGDNALEAAELKALSVGSDPDGGYTVTPDMSGRMVEKLFETSPIRQVASVQTINSDSLEGLYDLDEAASGWVSETGARTETNTPQFAKWSIPAHEQYAMPAATQKMLDDSSLNLEGWLAGKVQGKFSRTENAAFVNGDGVGKPRGFLTYADGTTIPNSIEQFATGVSGDFAGAGAGGDVFFDMVYGLKAGYRSGARFAMGRSALKEVRKIKDSDGNYVWQSGLAVGEPSTIAGYSTIDFEDMPDIGADSLSIAFANWGEAYQIVDRLGTRILRDPYTSKPYILFYTTKRTGGDVLNHEAIKLMKFGA